MSAMTRARSRLRGKLVVAAIAGSLLLVACGGSEEPAPEVEEPAAPDEAVEVEESETEDAADDASDLDSLIEAAQDEGSLTLYHASPEDQTREWVSAFEDEYGISVQQYRATTNPVWERWLQETQAGSHQADVVVVSDELIMAEADEMGMIADYTPAEDANFPADTPALQSGKWYPLYYFIGALVYNTNVVDEELEADLRENGFHALLNDTFEGNIALQSPTAARRPQVQFYQMGEGYGADEYGWDYIEQLASQNPGIFDSGVPALEGVVSGEYAAGFDIPSTSAAAQALSGAPIRWVYPDPAVAAPFIGTISEDAPSPNAARLFMEWALTAESLEALSEATNGVPPEHDEVESSQAIAQEDWYEAPGDLYTEWMTDTEFHEAEDELLARWTELFDFSG